MGRARSGTGKASSNLTGTAIEVDGQDSWISDVIVFSGLYGVVLHGGAVVMTNTHIYNGGSFALSMEPGAASRVLGCYFDNGDQHELGGVTAAGVVVVTTSNRVPDDLYKDGLNRQLFLPFIEIIKQNLEVWELVSPRDYRQDRLSGAQVYFTPADDRARREIEQVWEHLTGGQGAPLTLVVNKRQVEIPAFHNGVARASFYDLCGRPVSHL